MSHASLPRRAGRAACPPGGAILVELRVNGESRRVSVEPVELLVDVLRDRLGLTGTHVGCETTGCGACTVLLDGESVKSCTVLAVQADKHEVVTIEGLATSRERTANPSDGEAADATALHPVQWFFRRHHGLQCGFCTPGMVLAAVSAISEGRAGSEPDAREALEGNLCRCTGYDNIVDAVVAAAAAGETARRS